MTRPSARLAAAALAAAAGAAAAPAAADPVPSGRMSGVVGIRNGTGALGDAFGLGVVYGIEAAWEPMPEGRRLGYALHWNVLFGDFGADMESIAGELDILEMNLGLRLRLAPQGDPSRTVFFGGGAALLRANTPLPPDDARAYRGGFGGVGVELAFDRILLTLEVRYGVIGGPGAISVLLGIGSGV